MKVQFMPELHVWMIEDESMPKDKVLVFDRKELMRIIEHRMDYKRADTK